MFSSIRSSVIAFCLIVFLSRCASINYQIFDVKSAEVEMKEDEWIYQDSKIKVSYDLWFDGGLMNFKFTNTTDSSLYINWDLSHFIYNGVSYDYFNDVEETNMQSNANMLNLGVGSSSTSIFLNDGYYRKSTAANFYNHGIAQYSIKSSTIKSKKILHLPSRSSILVSKFILNKKPYYNCDFNARISSSIKKMVQFEEVNSPLTFRNYITYSTNTKFENNSIIDNTFYVSAISIINSSQYNGKTFNYKKCDFYGNEFILGVNELPFKKPSSYFIKLN